MLVRCCRFSFLLSLLCSPPCPFLLQGRFAAKAAAFFETRRYAAMLGATTEGSKWEGFVYSPKQKKAYTAISDGAQHDCVTLIALYAEKPCVTAP